MARKPGGRNNASKHGGFSQDLVLPDEKSEDFEQLHQSLIDEWSPTGALEEDTVLTLAQGIWLKRRVERFYHREAVWAQEHADEEELDYVAKVAAMLGHAKGVEEVTGLIAVLPDLYRKWIEQECPRSKIDDAQSWIQCVKSKILEIMRVRQSNMIEQEHSRAFKGKKAALLRDLTAKKISLDERLDGRIDKAIKRLAQLKTFKQVIEVRASQKSNEPRRISDQGQ
jgi:hypothetical protein